MNREEDIIDILFNEFPREFGKRRTLVKNKDELYHMIRRYNGMIDCYTGVYSRRENPTIDKLFFDFDSEDCLVKVKKFHNFLVENSYKHCMFFSGGGFHVYVFVNKDSNLKFPKNAIRNAQLDLIKRSGLEVGKDVDSHVIGDVRRITRIPNTFNIKPNRKRFCIPVSEETLEIGMNKIRKLARVQMQFVGDIKGKVCIELSKYDTEPDLGGPSGNRSPFQGSGDLAGIFRV